MHTISLTIVLIATVLFVGCREGDESPMVLHSGRTEMLPERAQVSDWDQQFDHQIKLINKSGTLVAEGRIAFSINHNLEITGSYSIKATESDYPEAWKCPYLNGEHFKLGGQVRTEKMSYINLFNGASDACLFIMFEGHNFSNVEFTNDFIEGGSEPYWVGIIEITAQ